MTRYSLRSAALAAILLAAPALAQDTPTLDHVERLVTEGRAEEARAGLLEWWEASRADASRRDVQKSLWLRGILTVDPAQAALDFRRLVVEFPGGAYSDDALLRLAQVAWASGDSTMARGYVDQLRRDYPRTDATAAAVQWIEGAGPAPQVREAPRVPAPAAEPAPRAQPERAAAPDPDAPRFAVQLGAFSDVDRARALYRRALDQGFEARLVRVPGSPLLRVRVGRFDSAAEAGELLSRLRAMDFVAALVRDANTEERVAR